MEHSAWSDWEQFETLSATTEFNVQFENITESSALMVWDSAIPDSAVFVGDDVVTDQGLIVIDEVAE